MATTTAPAQLLSYGSNVNKNNRSGLTPAFFIFLLFNSISFADR